MPPRFAGPGVGRPRGVDGAHQPIDQRHHERAIGAQPGPLGALLLAAVTAQVALALPAPGIGPAQLVLRDVLTVLDRIVVVEVGGIPIDHQLVVLVAADE